MSENDDDPFDKRNLKLFGQLRPRHAGSIAKTENYNQDLDLPMVKSAYTECYLCKEKNQNINTCNFYQGWWI